MQGTPIKLTRSAFGIGGIFGNAEDRMSGEYLFASLEHAYEMPDGSFSPKIAPGTYHCVRGMHCLEHYNNGQPFETFEITGVPDFRGRPVSKCLFHPGNFNADSDGCVLTGRTKLGSMVTSSAKAFAAFLKNREGCDEFDLIVE